MRRREACRRSGATGVDTIAGLTDRPPAVVIVVAAVGALGLSLLVGGVLGWERPPGARWMLGFEPTRRLSAVVVGLLLLAVAKGLAGRRLGAHRVLLGVLGVSLVGGLASQHVGRSAAVLVPLFVAVALIGEHFPTQPDLHRLRLVAAWSGGMLLVAAACISAWFVWRTPDLHTRTGGVRALVGVLGGFLGISSVVERMLPAGPDPSGILLLIGGCTALVVVLAIVAPSSAPPPATAAEWSRVAALAALPTNDTFAPFVLRHDKSYVFSADGRSAIGYRVLFGVAIAGGDPVGHRDARAGAVLAFLELCARAGWRPFVIGARGDLEHVWTDHGLHSVGIGDEVLADIESFTLDCPELRNVRQAVKRTRNAGVTTDIFSERDLLPEVRAELGDIMSKCWGGLPERGFSMNLDGLLAGIHPDAYLVVCRDAQGRAVAFQRHVVCASGTALSLDTMCRLPGAPNGVNERMIVDVLEWGRARDVRAASLNFAAFRPLFDSTHRSRVEAVGYRGIHLLDRWIKLESLYRFNAKFRPRWVPRSVVLRAWSDLPAILPAALAAEFGGVLDRRRLSVDQAVAAARAPEAASGQVDTDPPGLAHPPVTP